MKSLKLVIATLLASTPAFALADWNHMVCSGSDTTGHGVSLTAYWDSPIVNINGDSLRIVGETANGQGLVTESFVAINGAVVYDTIVPVSSNGLNIYQFNAVTQLLLAQANLSCTFYGNSTIKASVSNLKLFEPLKVSFKH